MASAKPKIDIAAAGYPAVREAFNRTLQLCLDKLSINELGLAQDILGAAGLDDDTPGLSEMLGDTALYSRKDTPSGRKRKRAIDRVAQIVERVHDPLQSAIAGRLPAAIYSIFKVEAAPEPDCVSAHDLFDDHRTITIMDKAMAAMIAREGEIVIAGRFLDLGPWYIGFGIADPIRKSETLAISLSLAGAEDREEALNTMHELIYPTKLHHDNLVLTTLEPIILALSAAIDADLVDVDDLAEGFGGFLSGKDNAEKPSKAIDDRTRQARLL